MLRFFGFITGAGSIARKIQLAIEKLSKSESDHDKLVAESELRALEIAQANRLANPDNPMVKLAIGLIAMGVGGHLFMVCFVSAFPFMGWVVHALPPPMNDWQGSIVLGLLGMSSVGSLTRLIR